MPLPPSPLFFVCLRAKDLKLHDFFVCTSMTAITGEIGGGPGRGGLIWPTLPTWTRGLSISEGLGLKWYKSEIFPFLTKLQPDHLRFYEQMNKVIKNYVTTTNFNWLSICTRASYMHELASSISLHL